MDICLGIVAECCKRCGASGVGIKWKLEKMGIRLRFFDGLFPSVKQFNADSAPEVDEERTGVAFGSWDGIGSSRPAAMILYRRSSRGSLIMNAGVTFSRSIHANRGETGKF